MNYELPSSWPEWEYQISVGSYGGLDDRHKRRTKKQPVGFAPPAPKKQAKRKRAA